VIWHSNYILFSDFPHPNLLSLAKCHNISKDKGPVDAASCGKDKCRGGSCGEKHSCPEKWKHYSFSMPSWSFDLQVGIKYKLRIVAIGKIALRAIVDGLKFILLMKLCI
jgi:hypothetical protein